MSAIDKKAFIMFSSPNKNGYTKKLLDSVVCKLKNYDIDTLDVYQAQISPCTSCDYCKTYDGCIYNDDFLKVDHALKTADLLIIASPIYNMNFPSPLKAVFDRMQQYFSMRFERNIKPPIKKSKKIILLLSCGAEDDKLTKYFMSKQIEMISSIINGKLIGTILLDSTDKTNKLKSLNDDIISLIEKIKY